MLIPLRLLMKLRMSRILALVKLTLSGSRDAGLSTGSTRGRPGRPRRRPVSGRGAGGRPRGFDALPDGLIELRDLCRRLPVAWIVLAGDLVFAARRLELIFLLEVL